MRRSAACRALGCVARGCSCVVYSTAGATSLLLVLGFLTDTAPHAILASAWSVVASGIGIEDADGIQTFWDDEYKCPYYCHTLTGTTSYERAELLLLASSEDAPQLM